MTARTGTDSEIKSPETIKYQRRGRLPGVELRTIFDSSRCYWFYSTGFEFFVPSTWRGEVWHQRRKEVLERGMVLAAHPGDVFASTGVLYPGSWDSLTIDANALAELGGHRPAWERLRLRPFSRLSPRLETLFQAVVQSLHSDLMECVRANLRTFLATVASELVEAEAPGGGEPALPSRAAERFECFRTEVPGAVSVEDLASETGVNRYQASRAFKRRFGLPPQAYQLRVRMGVAQRSLREGASPADVAADLGFVDQSHFTRHFKRLVGLTPSRYVRGTIIPTPTRPKAVKGES